MLVLILALLALYCLPGDYVLSAMHTGQTSLPLVVLATDPHLLDAQTKGKDPRANPHKMY